MRQDFQIAQTATCGAQLVALMNSGDRLVIFDFDGVIVPNEIDDPGRPKVAPELRNALYAFFNAHPGNGFLTGRGKPWEIPVAMGEWDEGVIPEYEQSGRLPPLTGGLANAIIMPAHGYLLLHDDQVEEMPVAQEARFHLAFAAEAALKAKELLATRPEVLAILHPDSITVQADRVNINVLKVPEQSRENVSSAIEQFYNSLMDGTQSGQSPEEIAQDFVAGLKGDLRGIPLPFNGESGAESPLKIIPDAAGAFFDLAVAKEQSGKGEKLLARLRQGLFDVDENTTLVLASDNFQPGGGDRPLAEVLLENGYNVALWQSLDSTNDKPKQPISQDDPLGNCVEIVFRGPKDLISVFKAICTPNANNVAALDASVTFPQTANRDERPSFAPCPGKEGPAEP